MRKEIAFNIQFVFTRKRHSEADWLILQAKCLLDEAERNKSASALVYAAFEARNAIEQLWFAFIILCHGGEMEREKLKECKKTGGLFRIMNETEPDYFKLLQFIELCRSSEPEMPKIIRWDLKKLKHLWHELSEYCHAQLHPADTLDDPKWFCCGVDLVNKTYEYFSENMKQGSSGVLRPEQMSTYTKQIWEDFRAAKITPEQAEIRLKLVQGMSALEMRSKRRK